MPARDQRLLIAAAAGMSALLLLGTLAGHSDLLAAAPLILIALPLLAGRYVGEDALERLRGGGRAPRRRRPSPVTATGSRRPELLLPRGGRLIAEALAVRPPPFLTAS